MLRLVSHVHPWVKLDPNWSMFGFSNAYVLFWFVDVECTVYGIRMKWFFLLEGEKMERECSAPHSKDVLQHDIAE